MPVHWPAIEKWAWKGRVTISVAGRCETLCETATLTDSTAAAPPRFASFVFSRKDLQFTTCYDIDDIFMFLPVCKPPHQFARLVAEGPDAEALKLFSKYISKKTQAIMMRASWDENLIGVLLFIPPTATSLLKYLKTPREFYHDTGLIAVLLFTHASIDERKQKLPRLQRRIEPALLSRDQWRQSLQEEKAYHLGLNIIQLPNLKSVLSNPDMSADIVFVHVAALRNIHNLPHLAWRRLYPEIRFCLYGTHETVPPSNGGGVVTFTPEALVNDAWAVLKTIRHIHAHPLWTCYLIPQVVGMALKLNELREDETPDSYM
ncbi:hypothetical protein B0H13DRAFT_2447216 [Mycena leptocephala]|nr:hypothetical protein B0H13DRAFT_2447216 [Mycena leptocephala]